MTSGQTAASDAALPPGACQLIPLLLGERSCNVVFVLDTSEDMRAALGSVKQLLIQTLLTKASLRDSLFNIMTFSEKVSCWSQHMLPCAPDTVYKALPWIHSVSCRPGRDLLAALSVAFTDPACQAVHLLIRGLRDRPEAVLQVLPTLAAGRPMNIFYLLDSGDQLDSQSQDYLQCLTHATRGSCYVTLFGTNGEPVKVIPLHIRDRPASVPTISTVNSYRRSTSVIPHQHNVSLPLLRCSLGNPLHPVTPCVLSGETLGSADFFPGCRVLARRELDGLYYLGKVLHEVQSCRGVWVIEFDHPGGVGLCISSSWQQLVCSPDMVNLTRAHARCLAPGDAVLSPWEPELWRYGPGIVMAGREHRDCLGADGAPGLRVRMWNGCVSVVPGNLAVYITASHHDRIARELHVAASAPSHHCNWSCVHSPVCAPWLCCTECCQSPPASRCCPGVDQWPGRATPAFAHSLGSMDVFSRAELDKKDDLKHTNMGKSEPSPSSSNEAEAREEFPAVVKIRIKQQRPPWRYWRRNGPEPQHRLPGSAARRTSLPARFGYPVLQISASANHSSLFQALPASKGQRTTIRDVFGLTNLRPPEGFQSLSGNTTTAIYIS